MRAALFNFNPSRAFISRFLAERIPHFSTPIHLSTPITPTRDFCIALLKAKIEATITNLGDPIGWPTDNNVVGPFAAAAKQSLLRLVPFLLPPETRHGTFYRPVIDHGDYGMWNMTSTIDENGKPLITSLFGWDMSSVVPAIFSDLKLGVDIDLVADEYGNPAITRLPHNASVAKRAPYKVWSRQYITVSNPSLQSDLRYTSLTRHFDISGPLHQSPRLRNHPPRGPRRSLPLVRATQLARHSSRDLFRGVGSLG